MNTYPFIEARKPQVTASGGRVNASRPSGPPTTPAATAPPGPHAVRNAELTKQITAVHQRSRGTYGAPRAHAVLQREGAGCGRRRVARLMRRAGIADDTAPPLPTRTRQPALT
ncbi:IS3 family transposase [Streptomyces sp. NPDC056534]|uniref:IS3 family transposase n=1 Tax=Streptomyces sp. NPDC056534 TaxID=3345857 RepID=UPI0036CF5B4E